MQSEARSKTCTHLQSQKTVALMSTMTVELCAAAASNAVNVKGQLLTAPQAPVITEAAASRDS